MNINDLIEKIETLETRQAFQEDTIESLNTVIIQLQKDIKSMQLKFKSMQEKVDQSADALSSTESEEPPPPHY
ncbi:MAG: SlyX protein [Enterobacterales bacterium]|jgi:SlyX protein